MSNKRDVVKLSVYSNPFKFGPIVRRLTIRENLMNLVSKEIKYD